MQAERLLSPFVPRGYDLYVLGVQEGVSDRVYEALACWTETFRVPLHTSFYSATVPHGVTPLRTTGPGGGNGFAAAYVSSAGVGTGADGGGAGAPAATGPRVRISRKAGRAVAVQQLIDEARVGIMPDPCTNTVDMLDRVWGRGDGALLSPKFTGLAVFVAPVVAPYTRVLSMFKHSFGASEGSKGGVGVALGCYDVTLAFVNCHLASKKCDVRRAQYCELVDRLGAKLGGRGALRGGGGGGGGALRRLLWPYTFATLRLCFRLCPAMRTPHLSCPLCHTPLSPCLLQASGSTSRFTTSCGWATSTRTSRASRATRQWA